MADSAGCRGAVVVVREIGGPLEAERALIESNRQRVKTTSEVMREAEQLKRIIAEEAKRRMLAGTTEDGAGGRGRGAGRGVKSLP